MTITVSNILNLPSFKDAKVLAGRDALDNVVTQVFFTKKELSVSFHISLLKKLKHRFTTIWTNCSFTVTLSPLVSVMPPSNSVMFPKLSIRPLPHQI